MAGRGINILRLLHLRPHPVAPWGEPITEGQEATKELNNVHPIPPFTPNLFPWCGVVWHLVVWAIRLKKALPC